VDSGPPIEMPIISLSRKYRGNCHVWRFKGEEFFSTGMRKFPYVWGWDEILNPAPQRLCSRIFYQNNIYICIFKYFIYCIFLYFYTIYVKNIYM
jgi:hypothetical protein